MYARIVHFNLKPEYTGELTRTMENQVIPLLKKQKGFRDEITFVSSDGEEATAISLWDSKQDAEAYNRSAYPEVLRSMERILEGRPTVENCEVSNSTFHKIASRGAGGA